MELFEPTVEIIEEDLPEGPGNAVVLVFHDGGARFLKTRNSASPGRDRIFERSDRIDQ